MKLYKISQNVNEQYDTYDSAVVCADSEEEARNTHPSGDNEDFDDDYLFSMWSRPSQVKVEYIGEADVNLKKGVVVSSFNAG